MRHKVLAFLTHPVSAFVLGGVWGGAFTLVGLRCGVPFVPVFIVAVVVSALLGVLNGLWRLKYLKEVKNES